jgi:hypothetical protein
VGATNTAALSATDAAACEAAHPARIEESADLSSSGRPLAPSLQTFNQYRLDLQLDPVTATLTGTETLVFTNRTGKPLADLVFHLYPNLRGGQSALGFGGKLDVRCAAFNGVPVRPVLEADNWLLRLPFAAPLQPDQTVEATIHFSATSPVNGGDHVYSAFNRSKNVWALASFYPILAIRTGDTWDMAKPNGWGDFVNSDMALYHVRVTTPAGQDLLATGEVRGDCGAERCSSTIAAGPQRDFTMALVQGWQQERRAVGDTTVVSSFPPDQRAAGERALTLTADAVARYNQRFGPYPYTEFDVLPIPASGFAGVEYPGLIMINDHYYIQTDAPQLDLQDVVVHEVAHEWWYNVVGNDVLREPWLDEGLTSYTGEYLYTEWSGQGQKPVTERRRAQLEQLGLDKTPIDGSVDSYREPRAYVAVIYGRAPLFFEALRREVGDAAFFRFLQEYYKRYAFSRATTAGFERLLEDVAGRQLDPFLAQWIKQRPG